MKSSASARFLRHPALDGVEICRVTRSSHVFPNHFHEDVYAISFMEEGGSYWTGREKSDSLVEPGHMALIPPGQVHSGSPFREGESSYIMFYLDKELLKKASSHILERDPVYPEFTRVVFSDYPIYAAARRLYGGINRSDSAIELETLLYEFLGPLVDGLEASSPRGGSPLHDNPRIFCACEYLSENLSEKISLEDAAHRVGMSPYHFLRTFKRTVGLPPHAFRTQKRIDAARKLILAGKHFCEVALETGFSDQSHFTHKFRDYTGVTPARYVSRTN